MNRNGKTALFASILLLVSLLVVGLLAAIMPVKAGETDVNSVTCIKPTATCNKLIGHTNMCTTNNQCTCRCELAGTSSTSAVWRWVCRVCPADVTCGGPRQTC